MREAQKSHQPIQLLVENTEYYRTVSLDYFDGPRHPHLVRDRPNRTCWATSSSRK